METNKLYGHLASMKVKLDPFISKQKQYILANIPPLYICLECPVWWSVYICAPSLFLFPLLAYDSFSLIKNWFWLSPQLCLISYFTLQKSMLEMYVSKLSTEEHHVFWLECYYDNRVNFYSSSNSLQCINSLTLIRWFLLLVNMWITIFITFWWK